MTLQGFYTDFGQALAAKIAAGTAPLTVTRVVAGSGHTADIPSATALPDIRQILTVGEAQVSGTTATLPVTLAEAQAEQSYQLTELGVYAADPDVGEVLFQIYQLSAPVDISTSGEGVLRFYLRQSIGNQGVTVVCSPAGVLLEADLTPLWSAINRRVEMVNAATTLHVTKTGSDTTGDGSEDHPYLTIQKAIDTLPRYLDQSATVLVHSGTYAENVVIHGFSGPGTFALVGESNSNTSVNTIMLMSCNCLNIGLTNLNLVGCSEDVYKWTIQINQTNSAVYLDSLQCTNAVTGGYYGAFRFSHSPVIYMANTTISNKEIAVDVSASSVYMRENVTGTSNSVSIRSGSGYGRYGGYVQKGSAAIAGTESKSYGGQIW